MLVPVWGSSVRNHIQGVIHAQGSTPAFSEPLDFLGAHMQQFVVSPVLFVGAHSHFPRCSSSVQHMSRFLLAAGGTMWFKSSSAIAFQGRETQPARSRPPSQALLRSKQGMGWIGMHPA